MIFRGIIAFYLLSPLSKFTNLENTSQFKFVRGHNSNRVIDFLLHNTIPIFSYNKLPFFHDTGEEFGLKGDLLKMITNKNYSVDLASLTDKKLKYDFANEMNFALKPRSNNSIRDKTFIKLLKLLGLMVSAPGVSNTIILPSDPDKSYNRLTLLLQEKHAGINSNLINEEFIALVEKLLEYKCISKKQLRQKLFKCNLLI